MSREITISYRETESGPSVGIEVRAPYFLFGTLETSKQFWSLPVWKNIGVERLAQLGRTDPIYFVGWEMMGDLANEIRLFQDHFTEIEFNHDVKSWFLAHLVYCHGLLIATAPRHSTPELSIG